VEEFLKDFIVDGVGRYGYLAVFVLMVLESACIPIPSEVTMVFGGFLASPVAPPEQRLNFILVGLLGTVANVVGSWLAYYVGLKGGRPLIERWGRFVFLRKHELDRAETWFAQHGEAAVFVSRLLPVIRTFISLPAGVAEMPLGRFTLYTFIGCLPWTFALTGAGYLLGNHYEKVFDYFRPISIVFGVLFVGAIAWWLFRRARARREETAAGRPS
jgi:membrane protein DedA with SNARE-associated domain